MSLLQVGENPLHGLCVCVVTRMLSLLTYEYTTDDLHHLLRTRAQAKQRTQLLEYYFEKHTLSGAEWAEIADKLGKNKVHVSKQ